jgi:hypothetical protein
MPPTVILVDVLFRDMPVTGIVDALTVTAQVDVLLPSVVVTVIVAFPAAMPETTPLDDTVAMPAALLLHVTALFVALVGATVAVSVSVPPIVRLVDDLFKVTLVTETVEPPSFVTETAQVAVLLPSTVVAVIAVLPVLMPIITPFDTIATSGMLLLHVTSLFAAFTGKMVALRVSYPPTMIDVVDLLRETPVTATLPPTLLSPLSPSQDIKVKAIAVKSAIIPNNFNVLFIRKLLRSFSYKPL